MKSKVFFIPTRQPYFCNIFLFKGSIHDIELYDLNKFIESFILYDQVYMTGALCRILTDKFIEHSPKFKKDMFQPVEDSGWNKFEDDLDKRCTESKQIFDLKQKEIDEFLSSSSELPPSVWHSKIHQMLDELSQYKHEYIENLEAHSKALNNLLIFRNFDYWLANQDTDDIFDFALNGEINFDLERDLLSFDFDHFALNYKLSLSPGFGFYHMFSERFDKDKVFDFYNIVKKQFAVDVDEVTKFFGKKTTYLPPLFTILLSRCRSDKDLIEQLINMRKEFSGIRNLNNKYMGLLNNSHSLKEAIDIAREHDVAQEKLTHRLSKKRERKVVKTIWDIVKGCEPLSMAAQAGDVLLDWDKERKYIHIIKDFCRIYDTASMMKTNDKLIEKCFPHSNPAMPYLSKIN